MMALRSFEPVFGLRHPDRSVRLQWHASAAGNTTPDLSIVVAGLPKGAIRRMGLSGKTPEEYNADLAGHEHAECAERNVMEFFG
jgi:hypothetical protein